MGMCACLAHGLLLEEQSQDANMKTFRQSIIRLFPLLIARNAATDEFDIDTTRKNLDIFWKVENFMESAIADIKKAKHADKEAKNKAKARALDYEYVVSVDSWTDETLDEQEMQKAATAAKEKEDNTKKGRTMNKVDNLLQDQLIHGLEQLHGVTFVIASPANDFEHLLASVAEETGNKKKMDELLKTKDACTMMQMDVGITTGITVGADIVGFCTPDSNPYQTQRSRQWHYSGHFDDGKKECTTWGNRE